MARHRVTAWRKEAATAAQKRWTIKKTAGTTFTYKAQELKRWREKDLHKRVHDGAADGDWRRRRKEWKTSTGRGVAMEGGGELS